MAGPVRYLVAVTHYGADSVMSAHELEAFLADGIDLVAREGESFGFVVEDGPEVDAVFVPAPHQADGDCAGHLDAAGVCLVCGVLHGDPCPGCGRRGFHAMGCPRLPDLADPWRGEFDEPAEGMPS